MLPLGSVPVREGELLAGKYRVERVLGAGGMGIVVAARHVELDQLVAIKFVRDEAIANEDAVQRFLREARAAVKLKSEHVARVLDVGKLESGAPYMVMEYLEGSDLGKVLDDHGPSSLDAAADWILQACEAVAEAHAAGIVHRDLKPENLFLARTVGGGQKIKVLDFGVSKAMGGGPSGALSGLTRTRAMLGSPLYMAPEQMRSSRDVDARADVWALGVVLFQLLTTRYPFEAETMPELCLKVVTEPPLSLASLRPDIPVGIVAVIERCLDKDAKRRFANAAELASALEPFVQPASRVLAERARLAMGGVSGTLSSPRPFVGILSPASTLPSAGGVATPGASLGSTPGASLRSTPGASLGSTPGASSGSTPGASSGSTPGTSVPWGSERVVTPALPPAPRSGSWRVPAGIAVAVIAGLAGFLLLARAQTSASSPRPDAPIAAASELPRPAAAPIAPVVEALPDRPTAVSAVPAPPPAASSIAAISAAPVVRNKPTALAHPPAGKPASPDDDIPTIR